MVAAPWSLYAKSFSGGGSFHNGEAFMWTHSTKATAFVARAPAYRPEI